MIAAFVYELLEVREHLAPERGLEIAIGFVAAFVSAAVVVRPFLGFVRRSGFAAFAWYRIALGLVLLTSAWMG
jgi:undecaprenyl-diphosphatase